MPRGVTEGSPPVSDPNEIIIMQGGMQEGSLPVSAHSDELAILRSCLRRLCMDHSTFCRFLLSWFLFLFLGVVVPLYSHFLLPSSSRATDAVVQICLTVASSFAFLFLFVLTRPNRLPHLLSINQLRYKSHRVRVQYTAHVRRFLLVLAFFVLPSAAGDAAYELWWFWSASRRTNLDTVVGMMEVASWVYRTGTFYLFRLICKLPILSLTDFAAVLSEAENVAIVQQEHLRVQKQLRIISLKFQVFIVVGYIIVTISQLSMVFLNTLHHSHVTMFNRVKLALCSIALVTGLLICLRNAAKITHRAQKLASHAAIWNITATMPSSENMGAEESDEVDVQSDVELDAMKLLESRYSRKISFRERLGLVKYFENNKSGITVFGFMVDRAWLYTIFMLELSLILWLLAKLINFP